MLSASGSVISEEAEREEVSQCPQTLYTIRRRDGPSALTEYSDFTEGFLLLECSYLQIDEDNMNKIFAAYTVHMLRNYNDKLVLHKPADFSVIKLKLTLKFYMYELQTFKC